MTQTCVYVNQRQYILKNDTNMHLYTLTSDNIYILKIKVIQTCIFINPDLLTAGHLFVVVCISLLGVNHARL